MTKQSTGHGSIGGHLQTYYFPKVLVKILLVAANKNQVQLT